MKPSDIAGLKLVGGHPFKVYASPGSEKRADEMAQRTARALRWLGDKFGGHPQPVLFVVGPADWPRVASIPLYGMPHAFGNKVVLGAEPAPFWQEIVDWFMPHLKADTRERLRRVYGDPPDLAAAFPDLVLVHGRHEAAIDFGLEIEAMPLNSGSRRSVGFSRFGAHNGPRNRYL